MKIVEVRQLTLGLGPISWLTPPTKEAARATERWICRLYPEYLSYIYLPWMPLVCFVPNCFKNWAGDISAFHQSLPFWSSVTQVFEKSRVEWMGGVESPLPLSQSEKGNASQNCCPSYFRDRGNQYGNNSPGSVWFSVLHPTEIYNVTQLLICSSLKAK